MPYTVRNTFHAQTPLGAGIQSLTRGLFGGATPEEQQAKLAAAEAHRAQAEHYAAQNEAIRHKMAREKAQDAAMAAAPAEAIAGLFGGKPQGDAIMAFRNGAQVDAPFGTGMTGSLDEQDVPAAKMAAPRPEFYTPDMEARANRTLGGIAAARALPGNDTAAHLATIIKGFFDDDIRQRAVSGGVDVPTLQRVGQASAAVAGKPLFHDGQNGGMDNFTGALVDPRLFNEKVGSEKAQANQRNAAAGNQSAHAGLARAQTEDVRDNKKQVPALDAMGNAILDLSTGAPVMMRADQRGQVMARGAQDRQRDAAKPPKTTAPKPPIKVDPKALRSELGRLTNEGDEENKLDPNFANEMVAQAVALAQDPDGEYWNNPIGALRSTLDGATQGRALADTTNSFRDKNKRFAPEGYKAGRLAPPRPITTAPAGVAPQGGSGDSQKLLREADEAIKRGADPAKVKERLKQLGIQGA